MHKLAKSGAVGIVTEALAYPIHFDLTKPIKLEYSWVDFSLYNSITEKSLQSGVVDKHRED